MKRNNVGLFFALTLITMLFSCKKINKEEVALKGPENIAEKVKAWAENQITAISFQKFLFEGNVIDIPQKLLWDETTYFADTKTNITKINIESVNGNLPTHKYLVTEMDEAGKINKGNYYVILSEDKRGSIFENITPEILDLKNIPGDFRGAIIKYDLNNNVISTNHYDGGVITDKTDKIILKKSKKQIPVENFVEIREGCGYVTIDWYWQTWINGVLVNEEYVGSSNIIVCDGSGGSGGGGEGTLTCEEQNENFVNQGVAFNGSVTTEDVSNNGTTWIRNYNWKIYSAVTWGLLSYEKGTLEKIHYPNVDRWEFKSFEHLQIAEVGTNIGGTRTFLDLGATINMTSTRMSVWERIDFSVSSKVACFVNPVTIPYNANKTFYAPNTVAME